VRGSEWCVCDENYDVAGEGEVSRTNDGEAEADDSEIREMQITTGEVRVAQAPGRRHRY
jgi:hypothetical protein